MKKTVLGGFRLLLALGEAPRRHGWIRLAILFRTVPWRAPGVDRKPGLISRRFFFPFGFGFRLFLPSRGPFRAPGAFRNGRAARNRCREWRSRIGTSIKDALKGYGRHQR